MENEILFSEKQQFRQVWIWLMLIGLDAFFIFILIRQMVLGHPYGNKPASNTLLLINTIPVALITLLFIIMRLETNIKKDGIYVRFFPFHRKFRYFSWDQLSQVFVREYGPMREYGGWGLKGFGGNKALNVSGDKGIQLIKNDGSKLLIGTNKPMEAMTVLKELGHWSQV